MIQLGDSLQMGFFEIYDIQNKNLFKRLLSLIIKFYEHLIGKWVVSIRERVAYRTVMQVHCERYMGSRGGCVYSTEGENLW